MVKRRNRPVPGSITEALDSFHAEVRFYREVVPVIGMRVPACYRTESTDDGTVLVLEDLAEWQPGADPLIAARVLSGMHQGWADQANARWPRLRPVGAAVDLAEELFTRVWPQLAARADLTPPVRLLGELLAGKVAQSEREISAAGPITLAHGDASLATMRTGPDGQVVLLDWPDASAAGDRRARPTEHVRHFGWDSGGSRVDSAPRRGLQSTRHPLARPRVTAA